ncbi:kinase-like domain-containing protein [Mycena vulgaris]|nr:kinase-like domain-containing protein [Mycena vulgaris]
MVKLSEACENFPSSLFITGVNNSDEHPIFYGGFGDIFRASYRGRPVVTKRLRVFIGDFPPRRTRVVKSLRHPFIVPLFGIASDNFPSIFCMVSPWMKNGTVLGYLKERGRGEADRLLLETAEGLNYLHSINIVHGDLHENNIVISDDFNVCLIDFGLANIIFDSQTTPQTTWEAHGGSHRS